MKKSRGVPKAIEALKLRGLVDVIGELSLEAQRELMRALKVRGVVDGNKELRTVTLREIEFAYGVSRRSLERYIAAGELRAVKIGRTYHVTLTNLAAWLDGRSKGEGAVP